MEGSDRETDLGANLAQSSDETRCHRTMISRHLTASVEVRLSLATPAKLRGLGLNFDSLVVGGLGHLHLQNAILQSCRDLVGVNRNR